jgi:hypothetical protein
LGGVLSQLPLLNGHFYRVNITKIIFYILGTILGFCWQVTHEEPQFEKIISEASKTARF